MLCEVLGRGKERTGEKRLEFESTWVRERARKRENNSKGRRRWFGNLTHLLGGTTFLSLSFFLSAILLTLRMNECSSCSYRLPWLVVVVGSTCITWPALCFCLLLLSLSNFKSLSPELRHRQVEREVTFGLPEIQFSSAAGAESVGSYTHWIHTHKLTNSARRERAKVNLFSLSHFGPPLSAPNDTWLWGKRTRMLSSLSLSSLTCFGHLDLVSFGILLTL